MFKRPAKKKATARKGGDEKTEWLRGLLPFQALDDKTLAIVAKLCRKDVRPIGTKLTVENSFGHEAFVISRGHVDVLDGEEVVESLRGGDYLGEMSMFDDPMRTATAIARSTVELAVFDRKDFLYLLDHVPALAEQVQRVAEARRRR